MPKPVRLRDKIPFVLLPFDSLALLLGLDLASFSSQAPLVCFYSLFYLCTAKLRFKTDFSHLLLGMLVVYLLLVSVARLITLLVDEGGGSVLYLAAATRQGFSLALGVTTFAMFLSIRARYDASAIYRLLIYSAIPVLLYGIFQFTIEGRPRAVGFSTEPAHFADYITLAVIPSLAMVSADFMAKSRRLAITVLAVVALALTLSFTGLAKFLVFAAILFFTGKKGASRWRGLGLLTASAAIVYLVFWQGDNYGSSQVASAIATASGDEDKATASFTDRFYNIYGPLTSLADPHSFLGYGLGADAAYLDRVLPSDIYHEALQDRERPQIGALVGKLIFYGGAPGALLAGSVFAICLVRSRERSVLFLMLAASLIALGPFLLPYIWFWLAMSRVKP